jgi:hypothetical protein
MARQFVAKMKGFVSQLADVGKTVDDDELKRYILDGFHDQYTPFLHLLIQSLVPLVLICALSCKLLMIEMLFYL